MNASHRRGACPGLSAPMPTGDGLLVRLMPAEPIPLDAFSVSRFAAFASSPPVQPVVATS